MKILILIGAHLCTAPRPFKEAETLANAGHDVTIGGLWFDPELVKRDRILINNKKWRFQPIIDFQPTTFLRRWKNSLIRLKGRIARERWQRWRTFSPELLGYAAQAMLSFARQTRADLTIVHSEAGLWVGNQLLDQGFQVGVDFEDWFSEDLLPADRVNRPIPQIKALESRLARECKYCITTSHALAEALSKAYQVPKPSVIYNAFPWAERQQIDGQKLDRRNHLPTLHWFSQTIGAGRGLETLFQALPYLNMPVEIHLRGNYPDIYRQWLEAFVTDEWRDRIFIHPTVPNNELLSRIAEHDIGLALERNDPPSRDLTVTNKLFQYLQAGLALIVTDTAGQREIFEQFPDIGQLIPSNNPQALAQAINNLLSNPHKLITAKSAALQAAASQLSWEKQAKTLVEAVNFAINRSLTG